MSRTRLYGSSKGMPFQRSTITSDDVPIPNTNRPGAADATDATDWAMHAGPRVKAGTMALPSRSEGRPHRGQREWREGVGAVGLGRPHVGVAQIGEFDDPLPLLVQRYPVERNGHAVSRRCHVTVPFGGG